eukprot:jgi/Psemu1/287941/fgenesh1_pg.222_\
MRTIFIYVISPIVLGVSVFPLPSEAFVGSRSLTKRRLELPSPGFGFPEKQQIAVPSLSSLREKMIDNDASSSNSNNNAAFAMLATDRDNKPNQGNFFYNDEVISHLYGYMYLVGFFAAQDGLFLGSFFIASSVAAWATQQELLPCNPRIPAIAAGLTLASTVVLRYIVGFEPPLETILGESYQGPTESSAMFELVICLLNIGWGFFGTWRTKEQVNGATYGF